MPLDLRKVVFSNAEVQAVMVNYCLHQEIAMPESHINSVELAWTPDLEVRINFMPRTSASEGKVMTFTTTEVAAAIIIYLHQYHDPLPRHAAKTLEPAGEDGLCLCLRLPWGDMWNAKHPGYTMDWQSPEGRTPRQAAMAKT